MKENENGFGMEMKMKEIDIFNEMEKGEEGEVEIKGIN